jgi:hypothetical protein
MRDIYAFRHLILTLLFLSFSFAPFAQPNPATSGLTGQAQRDRINIGCYNR